jgi:hypothetical protein
MTNMHISSNFAPGVQSLPLGSKLRMGLLHVQGVAGHPRQPKRIIGKNGGGGGGEAQGVADPPPQKKNGSLVTLNL